MSCLISGTPMQTASTISMDFDAEAISFRIPTESTRWKLLCQVCTRGGHAITMFGSKQRMVRSCRLNSIFRQKRGTRRIRCLNRSCCSRYEKMAQAESLSSISFWELSELKCGLWNVHRLPGTDRPTSIEETI